MQNKTPKNETGTSPSLSPVKPRLQRSMLVVGCSMFSLGRPHLTQLTFLNLLALVGLTVCYIGDKFCHLSDAKPSSRPPLPRFSPVLAQNSRFTVKETGRNSLRSLCCLLFAIEVQVSNVKLKSPVSRFVTSVSRFVTPYRVTCKTRPRKTKPARSAPCPAGTPLRS